MDHTNENENEGVAASPPPWHIRSGKDADYDSVSDSFAVGNVALALAAMPMAGATAAEPVPASMPPPSSPSSSTSSSNTTCPTHHCPIDAHTLGQHATCHHPPTPRAPPIQHHRTDLFTACNHLPSGATRHTALFRPSLQLAGQQVESACLVSSPKEEAA